MGAKHINGKTCLSCEDKLRLADYRIQDWFYDIKAHFPLLHISWTYRNEKDQNDCFANGSSNLKYPKSAHNFIDDQAMPCSRAIDVFEQVGDKGVWSKNTFQKMWDYTKEKGYDMIWGGNFKSIGDSDHFQIHDKE
jgi:hypothetical protein